MPIALAAAEPEARLKLGLKETGLEDAFQVVVSAEDMSRGSPDPEGYLLAAQQLGRPPVRCVVIGHSNQVGCCLSRSNPVVRDQWLAVPLPCLAGVRSTDPRCPA